jgi:putative membrane protein
MMRPTLLAAIVVVAAYTYANAQIPPRGRPGTTQVAPPAARPGTTQVAPPLRPGTTQVAPSFRPGTAQVASSVPLGDEYFAMKAFSNGMCEVMLGRLALERATQPDIKTFAERMVKDHTELNNKIVEAARRKGIPLPTTMDAIQSVALNRLAAMSGSDFDRAFLKAQMCTHKDALHLFEHQACKGEDSDLKELANQAISTLQDHTKSAFELAGEKAEYEKLCKIQKYAKEVMAEKSQGK